MKKTTLYFVVNANQLPADSKIWFFDNKEKAVNHYTSLIKPLVEVCKENDFETHDVANEFRRQIKFGEVGELFALDSVDLEPNQNHYTVNFTENVNDWFINFFDLESAYKDYEWNMTEILLADVNLKRNDKSTWINDDNQIFSEEINGIRHVVKTCNNDFYETYILDKIKIFGQKTIKIEIEINVDDNYDNNFIIEKLEDIHKHTKLCILQDGDCEAGGSQNFDEGNDNFLNYKISINE